MLTGKLAQEGFGRRQVVQGLHGRHATLKLSSLGLGWRPVVGQHLRVHSGPRHLRVVLDTQLAPQRSWACADRCLRLWAELGFLFPSPAIRSSAHFPSSQQSILSKEHGLEKTRRRSPARDGAVIPENREAGRNRPGEFPGLLCSILKETHRPGLGTWLRWEDSGCAGVAGRLPRVCTLNDQQNTLRN